MSHERERTFRRCIDARKHGNKTRGRDARGGDEPRELQTDVLLSISETDAVAIHC